MIPARRWVPWLLVAAGLLVYANSLSSPFVFDDESILTDRDIRGFVAPWRLPAVSLESPAAGRPVVHYSLALNHALGGTDVRGYRAVNIALHLACALALFGVVRRSLERCGRTLAAREAHGLAGAITLLWALHPLHSEVINYVAQRSESLMTLCYLLTLTAAIRALEAPRPRRWVVAACIACALGMAAKESMVTAPLMVLLWDLVFSGRRPRRLLRERWDLYAGLTAGWLVLAALMAGGPRSSSVGFDLGTGPLTWAANQCVMLLEYLQRIVWPHPLVLDYGYPRELDLGAVLPRAAVLAVLVAAALATLVRRPAAGFAAAWAFLLLAPTSSFVPIVTEVGAERRMYLALVGPLALAVVGGRLLLRRLARAGPEDGRSRRIGVAIVALAALALGATTVRRNRDYATTVSIWSTAVAARPDNPRAHANLGKALHREGRFDDAERHYRSALRLDPDYGEALNNLGSSLQARGRTDEAVGWYRKAIAVRPHYANAHYNLGTALHSRGELEQAVLHYREALRLRPDHARSHNNLGTALGALGRLDEAVGQFREALRLEPDYTEARRNLELAARRRDGPGER